MTLFQRLGGEGAIDAVVDKFYDLLLADTRVNHFFKSADLAKQRCRLKQFITLVTGGPHNYEGQDMKTAHCKLDIHKEDFDITWECLDSALLFYSVGQHLIDQLKAIFYSVQGDIVKPKNLSKVAQCPFKDQSNQPKMSQCPFKTKASQQDKPESSQITDKKLNNDKYLRHFY